ncbi:MAG: GntR family transcriptional regulator [Rhizobacter sp.]|jgi:DNA-binding GntR family transcriptional regulator
MPRTAPGPSKSRAPALAVVPGSGASGGDVAQRIIDAVTAAIVERRLMPGTRLAEQKIADIFKVSRTIVRQALHQLGRDKLITLEKSRGARVAQPSVEEARQVFEVRRMLEGAMIRRAAAGLSAEHIAMLRRHLDAERAAVQRTDVPGRTRLLADFHVVLARLLGNDTLADILRDLLSRSSLISLMYQSAHSAEHSWAEHVAIVDAIERRDARAAERLMVAHLEHVEHNLQALPRVPDLAAVLRPRPD